MLFLLLPSLYAADWDGTCGEFVGFTIRVPEDYNDLQDALDAAVDGDRICVADGQYRGNFEVGAKSIELRSLSGPVVTMLDGLDTGGTITFDSSTGATSILAGFTILGGARGSYGWDYGGGVRVIGDNVTLEDVVVEGNEGGGVYVEDGSLVLRDSTVSNNEAASGAGVLVNRSVAEIASVSVSGNHYSDCVGAGITFYDGSSGTVEDADIRENTGSYSCGGTGGGGGLYLYDSDVAVERAVFAGNDVDGRGGAVYTYCPGGCTLSMSYATMVGNEARNGGAVFTTYSNNTFLGSSILADNHATSSVDGIWAYSGGVSFRYVKFWGQGTDESGTSSTVGSDGNEEVEPDFVTYGSGVDAIDWDLHLCTRSTLRNAGYARVAESDGTRAGVGAYAGPGGDLDWYADTDLDRLPDGWEDDNGLVVGTDDSADDGDNDGLDNLAELTAGTFPGVSDTDGDGAQDGDEVAMWTDPLA